MGKHLLSIDAALFKRIKGHGRGWVFTANDFADLGSRSAVASALKRYKDAGSIRQIARGFYDYPKTHPELGFLEPSIDAIAKAVAKKHQIRIQPSGAYAANLLHLSDQVPMKAIFLTDGPSRTLRVGQREVVLKQTSLRRMAAAGKPSGLVIEALRYLGQEHITPDRIETLRRLLSSEDKKMLMLDLRLAPIRMRDMLKAIAKDEQ